MARGPFPAALGHDLPASAESAFRSRPQHNYREENAMTRLPLVAAAVLAIAASAPIVCTTTSPASAQGWHQGGHDGGGEIDHDLGDLLRDRIQTREDMRDFIADLLRDRPELRRRLRERLSNWRGRGEDAH